MTMSGAPIVIAGATLEGWLAAAVLARRLRPLGRQIVVVPTTEDTETPPALATSPDLGRLHQALGLDERDIVKSCEGSFRLGRMMTGFGGEGRSFVMGFGPTGAARQGVNFHQYWVRAAKAGMAESFSSYNLAALAGTAGRFAPPQPGAEDARGSFEFGLHLDGVLYTDYLRRCAVHYGTTVAPALLAEIERGEDGNITSLKLANDESIPVSLVVDAAGPRSCLRHASLPEVPAVTWETKATKSNPSLTAYSAVDGGYEIRIPLHARTVIGTCHPTEDHKQESEPWTGNCVAIGRSAFNTEPLFDPLTTLVTAGIENLIDLLPSDDEAPILRREYNRRIVETFSRFTDFQALFHALSQFDATPPLSPDLARKVTQFKSRGRIVTYDHESFDTEAHAQLYLGLGLMPSHYDALADLPNDDQLKAFLTDTKEEIARLAAAMPDQKEWLLATGIWDRIPKEVRA